MSGIEEQVQRIKDAISIEDVVSEYVKLKPAGRNLRALCPFHAEKTPSFFVSPERQTFKCFGCGKGGDVITFIQEIEGLEFKQALQKLAQKAGIEIDLNFKVSTEKTDTYFKIQQKAIEFYRQRLFQANKALEYLKKRGINEALQEKFKIGYAPCSWDELYKALSQEFDKKDLLESGLFVESDKSGNIFDKFRCRVMFPIFNSAGKPVAFTGRILPGDEEKDLAKYLNSPETKYFKKSQTLFGYNLAKQSIRKYNFAILTEGQMDVIALFGIGFSNAVASSGTSVTPEHLKLISRLTKNLILAFDPDQAGRKSAIKTGAMALEQGFNVKVIEFEEELDPADFVLQKGKEEFSSKLRSAVSIFDFAIKLAKEGTKDKLTQIKNLKDTLFPLLEAIKDPLEKKAVIDDVASKLLVSSDTIESSLELYQQKKAILNKQGKQTNYSSFPTYTIFEKLVAIYLWKNQTELKEKILQYATEEEFLKIQEKLKQNLDDVLFVLEKEYPDEHTLQKDTQEYLRIFAKEQLNKKKQILTLELKEAEMQNDEEKQSKILRQIQEINAQIIQLST